MIRSIFLAAAGVMAAAPTPAANEAIGQAQPVAAAFYAAVIACGRKPPLKPAVELATSPGAIRYDPHKRAIVIVPYDVVDPGTRAAMERFAAIGTLGLSGQKQYVEVFNSLLVAHELGHWIQEISRRTLTRWQVEYEANRPMVAFCQAMTTAWPRILIAPAFPQCGKPRIVGNRLNSYFSIPSGKLTRQSSVAYRSSRAKRQQPQRQRRLSDQRRVHDVRR